VTPHATADVLIVGGGPAGCAAAYWLASRGHAVTVVERRRFPRSKACGDVLSPRAVAQLRDMGLGGSLQRWHRLDSVAVTARGSTQELDWPRHPDFPRHGLVARRRDLDVTLAEHAATVGAQVCFGHDAVEPIVERGFVRGATIRSADGATSTVSAPYVIVADGANSTFGRALGTFRTRGWPYATAIRSYWPSPRHGDGQLEISLDLTDRTRGTVPGFGWVAPVGDGTVNVGALVLSTASDAKSLNEVHLFDGFVAGLAERWELDPSAVAGVVRVGRIPMGGSVQPTAGPSFVVVGDAAGVASPFSGLGIDASLETARMASDVIHEALTESGPTALQRYPRRLTERYGEPYKTARFWARAVGHPAVMRNCATAVVHSETLASAMLRIMTGMTRPGVPALPETASRIAAAVLRLAPDA
jgi:geranylgeranyl reductase family protein